MEIFKFRMTFSVGAPSQKIDFEHKKVHVKDQADWLRSRGPRSRGPADKLKTTVNSANLLLYPVSKNGNF